MNIKYYILFVVFSLLNVWGLMYFFTQWNTWFSSWLWCLEWLLLCSGHGCKSNLIVAKIINRIVLPKEYISQNPKWLTIPWRKVCFFKSNNTVSIDLKNTEIDACNQILLLYIVTSPLKSIFINTCRMYPEGGIENWFPLMVKLIGGKFCTLLQFT